MAQIGRLRIFHSPDKLTPDKNAGPVEPGYHTDISAIVRLRVGGGARGIPKKSGDRLKTLRGAKYDAALDYKGDTIPRP